MVPARDGAAGTVLLASRSARRRALLKQAGVRHVSRDPGVDDGGLARGRVSPAQWVASLAYLKAVAGLEKHPEHPGTVMGADTVCVVDGQILGQPRDRADAERMLRLFENRPHEVLTGVATLSREIDGAVGRRILVDGAVVHVGDLGAARISEYLDTGLWRGKAGAYNLEERVAAGWPIVCVGDPTTVVGLPMGRLIPIFGRLGLLEAPGGRAT
jgi:septum formation protein